MRLSDFDYILPKELIAQHPVESREKCKLMVLDRKSGSIKHRTFKDITSHFEKGDLLVLNNTKVIPARLFGKRKTGGKVEIFLLNPLMTRIPASRGKYPECEALVRPSGRIKEGERLVLESGDEVEVLGQGEIGRMVRFGRFVDDIMKEVGHVPLPPYIDRRDEARDRHDYQTIYASREGATASPTAGLHFTEGLLNELKEIGVRIEFATLHTNYGTFAPVKTDDVESHIIHKEYFELSEETAKIMTETKKGGHKIFAVGTTTTRVLEYCSRSDAYGLQFKAAVGYNDLFIYPGYEFKAIDGLITNFHLPKSTLMLLVSAFAGRESILKAYSEAIEKSYRFFSYGDAMLIV